MSNKHMNDEYQYPGEEYIATDHQGATAVDSNVHAAEDQSDEAVASSASWVEKLKSIVGQLSARNRRIIIVIVIALVALVVFNFLIPHHQTAPVTNPNAALNQQLAQSKQLAAEDQAENNKVQSDVANVQQAEQQNSQTVSALQNKVEDLQNTIGSMNDQESQLQAQLGVMSQQLQKLTDQLKPKAKPVAHKQAKPTLHYVFRLRAVVPDRAWIQDQYGDSMSVTVGDKVKQYGVIKSIDADDGVVQTTSGKIIRYGNNDF